MWKLDANGRITHWRRFRKTLDTLELEPALQATADFWHACPFVPYYLDPEQPETWPNPWELILDNYYCDLAKCLGMLYTLYLSNHRTDMEIRIYNDPSTTDLYNLVWIDSGKYVLNFDTDKIVNRTQVPNNLKLLAEFNCQQLKLHNY